VLPQVSGAALPQFGQGHGTDPAIGLRVPDISAVSLDGEIVTIEQANGRGKVYGFFAHWCPHCQVELPRLVAYFETIGLPEGVDFHAVSTAINPDAENFPPERWFATEEWPFPVLDDSSSGEVSAAFGLPGFPYFVVVDGDGNVTQRLAGELSDDVAVAALLDLAADGVS
jgi:thiol-disulfide isomerase/thioredoxin